MEKLSVKARGGEVDTKIIDAEALPFYSEDLYFNMNRTEDYNMLLNKLRLKEKEV